MNSGESFFDRSDSNGAAGNRSADTVLFDPGFTYGAVDLVVDALQSARRVVEDMRALITAGRDGGRNGGNILWTMYPFLDDSGNDCCWSNIMICSAL